MKSLHRVLSVAAAAFFIVGSASAQTSGTVTSHAFAIGKGPGQSGFTSLLCASSQIAIGQTAANPLCLALSGDVTMTAAGVTVVGANKITNAMLRQSAALSLIGRSANSTGNVADISATAGSSCAFREGGSTVGCGTLATAAYAANSVTNAKLAQMANGTTKCRATALTGDPEDCTASQMRTLLALVPGVDVQAFDADLSALATNSTNGLWARTGAGTGAARTITGTANEVCVTSGDGVSGNPTLGICAGWLSTAHSWSGQQTFTNPIVGTQSPGDNSTKAASTAYADAIAALKANAANSALTGITDLQGSVKFTGVSSPASIGANQNDYNPGSVICATASTLRLTSSASYNITGLSGGVAGCQITIFNIGANPIVLSDQDGGSIPSNRFALGGSATIAASGSYTARYDAVTQRWRALLTPGAGGGGGGGVTSVACAEGTTCSTITTAGTVKATFGRFFMLGGL